MNSAVRIEIINTEIEAWENTLFLATLRQRVGKRIGDQEYEGAAIKEMYKAQQIIQALRVELENEQAILQADLTRLPNT